MGKMINVCYGEVSSLARAANYWKAMPYIAGISARKLAMNNCAGLCCALLGISASISDAQELPERELRQVFAAMLSTNRCT